MSNEEPTIKAAIFVASNALQDGHEPVSAMEPLLFGQDSRHRPALTDLVVHLVAACAGFERSLPPAVMQALAGWRAGWNVASRSTRTTSPNVICGDATISMAGAT